MKSHGRPVRIVLVRHGRPDIPVAPEATHHGFRAYIGEYEDASLDPSDLPPAELRDLVGELTAVFTSDRKRAHQSAKAVAPDAELLIDPLFVEASLASPPIPLLKMKVTKWAVVSRVLWYAGFHPGIETYWKARRRAAQAVDILAARAVDEGRTALVAHGFFNYLIGRELSRRGFHQTGSHKARFWNAVIYERP